MRKLILIVLFLCLVGIVKADEYTPPANNEIDLNFEEYTIPNTNEIVIDFGEGEQPPIVERKRVIMGSENTIKGIMGE